MTANSIKSFSDDRSKFEPLEARVGTCDFLKVVSVIDSGAFLYCGEVKDLFVPIGEQHSVMKVGQCYVVYIYRDEKTGRVAASSRLNRYIFDEAPEGWRDGDAAEILVYAKTDMGYKAIVNHDTWGLLYANEVFQPLNPGQKLKGFIKKIRPDKRVDLALHKPGFESVPDLTEQILQYLHQVGGRAPLTDKTPPEVIYSLFGVSKKKFKMALGTLYKQKQILISLDGIKLS